MLHLAAEGPLSAKRPSTPSCVVGDSVHKPKGAGYYQVEGRQGASPNTPPQTLQTKCPLPWSRFGLWDGRQGQLGCAGGKCSGAGVPGGGDGESTPNGAGLPPSPRPGLASGRKLTDLFNPRGQHRQQARVVRVICSNCGEDRPGGGRPVAQGLQDCLLIDLINLCHTQGLGPVQPCVLLRLFNTPSGSIGTYSTASASGCQ
mmetsp:Transcript_117427/g.204498  ORF Transcript_117427/g.204498 Transcript_117427/m.204498 type:complete len:202 (+) Transcript_117427:282-887(+)